MLKRTVSIVAFVVLAASAVEAQPGGGRGRGGSRMDPSMMLGPVFASMADADRSGDVTTAEWQGFLTTVKEKEGTLDRDALKADIVNRALDRDADGKLTGKDIEPIFAEMDRDGDKVISAQELRGRGFGRGQGRDGRGEGQGGDRRRGGGGNRGDGGNDDGATTGDGEKSDESKKKAPRKEDLYRQDADQDPEGEPRRGRGRGQDPEGDRGRRTRTFDMTAMVARSANGAIVRMADADSNDEVTETEWKEFVSKFDSKAVVGKLLAPAPRPEGDEGENERGGRGRRGARSLGDTLDRYFGRDEQEVKTKKQVEEILKGMDRDGDGALKKEEMQPRRLGRAA